MVEDEARWHIFAGIKEVHLKFGNGDRWDINNKDSITNAVNALGYTSKLGEDKSSVIVDYGIQ